MRFNYLNLRAVGHFTDYELMFDPYKNFHLIYGPNEAGKSTALRSITHFLYGFPAQTSDSFLHSNSKLRIEGQLKNSNGEVFQFARRKGNKNTVLDENGTPLNEELVNEFINGITEKHFTNMFALDHVRLREGGDSLLQSGGNLGESLFSAASGISLLRKVFEDLEKKSGEIYKKKASNPKLNKLIKEEKELLKEISEYQLKIQAWKDLEARYNEGKKEIESLIKQVRSLRSHQEKLQRIKMTLPKIAKLRDTQAKLEDLGDIPNLADNSEELRKVSEQKLENAKRDKKKAEENKSELEMELNAITISDGLIEQETLIDALYRELQSYQNYVKQLPRLEAEKQHLHDRVITFLKDMDSIQADLENINLYRLSAEKKDTILALSKQKPLFDQAYETLLREQKEINDDLQNKKAEFDKLSELPDIQNLEFVIDSVKRAGKIEESLHSLIRGCQYMEQQIEEEISSLPLWNGTYQELMQIPVPGLMETVKKFDQEQKAFHLSLQKVQEQMNNQQEAKERHEESIRALESLAEIPSEDKLNKLRNRRDQGWKLIRTKLKNGSIDEQLFTFTNGQELETVYEDSVRDADTLADKMRLEAARVGEKNKLLSDIENCKKKIIELEGEHASLKNQLLTWEEAWIELWKPTCITPLTPEEMKEWLVKYSQIKTFIQELVKSQDTIIELEAKKVEYSQSLRVALVQYVAITEEISLEELLNMAERYQKKIREDLYKRNNLEASIREIKVKLNNNAINLNDIETKIISWKNDWKMAIHGTSLLETTPTSVAESLLSKYESGVKAFDELKFKEKEQDTIQAQITIFEKRVIDVLQNINLNLNEQNVDVTVNLLNAALGQAKQDKGLITNIQSQLKKLHQNIKEAVSEMEEAESTLNGLMNQANCNVVEELIKIEKTFAQKKVYEATIRATEEELLILGNGRSIHELIAEADQIDQDTIQVELDEIQRELEEIEPKRSQLEQEHGVVKKEFEDKIQGASTASVLAEQNKASLLAQIAHLTDQYIQLKLASTLLQKGIEHYRNQNQDPILKRASDLFARLTLQSFVGLMVDFDEKDQPVLIGIRENGDKVPIDGMSDGTTDQLYLSLRIASIEKYSSENEPIPFIVDDILVHFDDKRSEETLKILLELSKQTQIIFFTHHSRLVDILKEMALEHEYQINELTQTESLLV
jgi:uncharacterized protein YhaN